MAHKVFVSYKYADNSVRALFKPNDPFGLTTTVRDYVDIFENKVQTFGIAVYKGEHDGEDLSQLSESTILEKLKDRIYDSSVTIVFISPNMRELFREEKDQWIPREISYSLREQSRAGRVSHSNSLLCVVLPDRTGNYYYYRTMSQFNIINNNINNGYSEVVHWDSFIQNIDYYIGKANLKKDHTPSWLVEKTI